VVKAALLDVVDLLHQCADVHGALHMPDQGRLTDAARYLQQLCFSITKYRLNRLAIPVLFSADELASLAIFASANSLADALIKTCLQPLPRSTRGAESFLS
jgi:hypothetical protein